jgi:MFS family permease
VQGLALGGEYGGAATYVAEHARPNYYGGLWYPISVAVMTVIVGGLFLRETKDIDITTASAVEISRRV